MEHNEEHVLLLHIGTPKTGSTALQQFLYENADVLEEYGWCYPKDNALGDKNGNIFYDVVREKIRFEPEYWENRWKILRHRLEKYNVILCSENIYDHDMIPLITKIKEEYENVKILIYLRRQDLYIESYWNQCVKLGLYTETFKEFTEEFHTFSSIHYLANLNELSKIVGKDNLIVRGYEKGQMKDCDLYWDFFDAIGLKVDRTKFFRSGRANERLSGNILELKRVFNLLKNSASNPAYQQYFMELCQEERSGGAAGKEGYFTKEEREAFLKQFEEENEIIARQYLHRKDGKLFYDKDMEIPLNQAESTPFEQEMIRLFALIIDREINRIKECMVNMKSRGRKIVYFGGGNLCKQLLLVYKLDVSFVIDNDLQKKGKKILGVPVVGPEEIENWKDLLIIVSVGSTKEIEKQLQTLGLIKWEDYLLAQDIFFHEDYK